MIDRQRLPIGLLRLRKELLVVQGQTEMVPRLRAPGQQACGGLELRNRFCIFTLMNQLFALQQRARARIRTAPKENRAKGQKYESVNARRFLNDQHSRWW